MELTAVVTAAEEGGFVALNPETGTTSQGETLDEAIANLQEATALYLEEFPQAQGCHAVVTTFNLSESAWAPEGLGCRDHPDAGAARLRAGATARRRGSHVVLRRGLQGCVVPLHKELKTGTLAGILRQAEVSADEFIETL